MKLRENQSVPFVEIEGKYDIESELEIYLQVFTDWCYKRNMETYCVKCRKNTKDLNSKDF